MPLVVGLGGAYPRTLGFLGHAGPRLGHQLARDLRQQVVGDFFLGQRLARGARRRPAADLPGQRPRRAVAGDLVVLDFLRRRDEGEIGRGVVLAPRPPRSPRRPPRSAPPCPCTASLLARHAEQPEHLLQPFDLLLRLFEMVLEREPAGFGAAPPWPSSAAPSPAVPRRAADRAAARRGAPRIISGSPAVLVVRSSTRPAVAASAERLQCLERRRLDALPVRRLRSTARGRRSRRPRPAPVESLKNWSTRPGVGGIWPIEKRGLPMLSSAAVNAFMWVISRVIRNWSASFVPGVVGEVDQALVDDLGARLRGDVAAQVDVELAGDLEVVGRPRVAHASCTG